MRPRSARAAATSCPGGRPASAPESAGPMRPRLSCWRVPQLEAMFEENPQRDDAVAPADLLAFFVCASVVADGNFVDAVAALEDLGGDLRLDAKAVGLEIEAVEDLAPHHLVAGLHVRQH